MAKKNLYCWSRVHSEPCRLPCRWCAQQCPPDDQIDNDINRRRTDEWEARKPVGAGGRAQG